MILKCHHCGQECSSKEQLTGHISGHVRKGEIPKRKEYRRSNHQCRICGLRFESKGALISHNIATHQKSFDELRSDAARKRRLIKERGHLCEICKNTTWMSRLILIEIDHIDGNITNNKKENLRLICPNCHAQTDTYKGKNIGKGQTHRSINSKRFYQKHFASVAQW